MHSITLEIFNNQDSAISRDKLDEYFAQLTPITTDDMIGKWRGGCIKAGSPFEFLLKKTLPIHWHGKTFKNVNAVSALVMNVLGAKIALPFFGSAIIREIKFREKTSVSMIYNYLPIIDHFRRIDDNTLMGVMTIKDRVEVYFYLKKEL